MNNFVVIFDMDGVIVNSEPIHQECEREMFRKLNISLTQKEHDRFMGISGSEMWKQIIDKFELDENAENLVRIQNNCFIQKLENSNPFPIINGITDLIDLLSENKVLLLLASSSSQKVVNKVLSLSCLKKYFRHIVNGSGGIKSKPEPDIFLKAAGKGKVSPNNCIVIEDSENGIIAAKRAKMKVIGLLNGTNTRENVSKADLVVNDLAEITIETLLKLRKSL